MKGLWWGLLIAVTLAVGRSGVRAQAIDLQLRRGAGEVPAWVESTGRTNRVHVLESSPDLQGWREWAVMHDGPFAFPDLSAFEGARFFRARSRTKLSSDDGKSLVMLPDDPFANEDANYYELNPNVRWIKFLIRLDEPHRVYFQNSRKHLFHYDFARLRVPAFAGMSRVDFDAVTLHTNGQVAVLGAVLLPPATAGNEFGIQFVGQDELPAAAVARWYRLVKACVQAPPGARAWYVPTFEQAGLAQREQAFFTREGIDVTAADRWVAADACYSRGWAVGRLVVLKAVEITAAYADGRLKPTDILVLDGVPAEVPYVSGILSLTPATPNSHVAILARSFGVPFGFPASAGLRSNLVAWAGREVAVRVTGYGCEVKPLALEGPLDDALRAQWQSLKQPPSLALIPRARLGAYSTNVTLLKPADVKYVGGKAANYGLLRRVLPTNSPPAIALTFDLWDDFLAQNLPDGGSLREAIARHLGAFTYPPDIGQVRSQLSLVRDLIRRTARFTPGQQQAILSLLQDSGLPWMRQLRFRSSTNVEDTEQFTGAGLYDSYSGCLPDDLDADGVGPSACDATESDERGVFRAIQRVYASFYNENAFLERLRHRVNEDQVGMAILVAESFPDEDELANGVTTLNWDASFSFISANFDMVTQPGAESVTNPDPAARPELVQGFNSGGPGQTIYLGLRQSAALLPLGATVLAWEREYQSFGTLFLRLASGYQAMSGLRKFTLDFEFKKSVSRGLQVKQVRLLPQPKPGADVAPFLFNEPGGLVVLEGEHNDVFAIHRLKSRWQLSTRNLRVDSPSLASTIYSAAAVTRLRGADVVEMSGGFTGWPEFRHGVTETGTTDSFTPEPGVTWALGTEIQRTLPSTEVPWQTQVDLRRNLSAKYVQPVPTITWEGRGTTTSETVVLVSPQPVTASSLQQHRQMKNASKKVAIETRFYWPEPPRGPTAGYTAPNLGFVETRITGLISEAVVLRSGWSQTYRPGHHNFVEDFLFEPRLDPELSVSQRAALEAANIRLIHVFWDQDTAQVTVVGFDNRFRSVP